jgi:hypothetical protein
MSVSAAYDVPVMLKPMHLAPSLLCVLFCFYLAALAVGLPLCRYGASRVMPYTTSILGPGLSAAFFERRVAC